MTGGPEARTRASHADDESVAESIEHEIVDYIRTALRAFFGSRGSLLAAHSEVASATSSPPTVLRLASPSRLIQFRSSSINPFG